MTAKGKAAKTLGRFGQGAAENVTVATAALMASSVERPGLVLSKYLRHLEKLAVEVGHYARAGDGPAPVELMAEALGQVLGRRYGYGGGDALETDPDAQDLAYLIDGRCGSPEAVSILYADIARRAGWQCEIVAVPGRVVARLQSFGERMIVDPAGGGREMTPQDLRAVAKAMRGMETEIAPGGVVTLSDQVAVLTLLAARKSLLLRAKRLEDAGRVIDCALLIAPDEASLWREYGLLNARLDRVQDAIAALEEYLRLGDDDGARYNTSVLLRELRARLG